MISKDGYAVNDITESLKEWARSRGEVGAQRIDVLIPRAWLEIESLRKQVADLDRRATEYAHLNDKQTARIAELEQKLSNHEVEIDDYLCDQLTHLANQRDIAIDMLAEWCVAVDKNGTGWDDWDEHYKDAKYRPTPIRELLDQRIREVEKQY